MKEYATKRLTRDIAEVERCILYNVSARPLESDLFTWHVNMVHLFASTVLFFKAGPPGSVYADVVFHLIMKFSVKYPRKPPVVNVCCCTTLILIISVMH